MLRTSHGILCHFTLNSMYLALLMAPYATHFEPYVLRSSHGILCHFTLNRTCFTLLMASYATLLQAIYAFALYHENQNLGSIIFVGTILILILRSHTFLHHFRELQAQIWCLDKKKMLPDGNVFLQHPTALSLL